MRVHWKGVKLKAAVRLRDLHTILKKREFVHCETNHRKVGNMKDNEI